MAKKKASKTKQALKKKSKAEIEKAVTLDNMPFQGLPEAHILPGSMPAKLISIASPRLME